MKKLFLLTLGLAGVVLNSSAQPVWKDVASIFYDNCTTCHRPAEIGADYVHATGYASLVTSPFFGSIPTVIQSRLMPPWKADPSYTHFLDERILDQSEIDLISEWINNGAPAGDTSLAPPPPTFAEGSQLGTPDTVLQMAQSYNVPGDFTDHYMVFVLPTAFPEGKKISAIEFRPGNAEVVHHVFIYTCNDGSAAALDATTPEYGYPSYGGAGEGVNVDFLGLYGPGMSARFYPPGSGINFQANTSVVIQVHYAPIDHAESDQSSVNLFYADSSSNRNVKAKRVGEQYVTEPIFFIPKDKVLTFHEEFPIDADYSIFAIAPHMHQIGKSFKIYAETPAGDSIPLIYIPSWDFHWQLLYSYPFMIKLPQGTIVKAEATYDNTVNNPNNPNNPPVNVAYGESSTDEMFKFFMNLLEYQPGDETIILDTSWVNPVGIPPVIGVVATPQLYLPSPNPASSNVSISYYLPDAADTRLFIYDISGRLVNEIKNEVNASPGFHLEQVDVSRLVGGQYLCTLETSGRRLTKSFIVQH